MRQFETQSWARTSGPRLSPLSATAGAPADWFRAHLLCLGFLSGGAAAIHLAVVQSHFDEWWGFGAFFVASGVIQLAWAIAVVASPATWLLWLGATGNVAIVGLWVLTRTGGLPLGPHAGQPEVVGLADVAATAFEVLIAVGAATLLRAPRWLSGKEGAGLTLWVVASATLVLTVLGLLSAGGAASSVIPPSM